MKTEHRLFHKGNEEQDGSKESCEKQKKALMKKHSWKETDFEIKDGFKPRPSFRL